MTTLYVAVNSPIGCVATLYVTEFTDRLRGNTSRVSILAGRLEDKGRVHLSEASPIVPVSVSTTRVFVDSWTGRTTTSEHSRLTE